MNEEINPAGRSYFIQNSPNSTIYNRKIMSSKVVDTSNNQVVDSMLSDLDPFMEQAEVAELGISHEVINDELYLPSHPSRGWIHCYISTTGPGCYRMYLEGKKRVRFLLSAKQFGNDPTYYISSSEDFPVLENVPVTGYLARLERQRDDSFLLSLHNQCHLCDNNLGYFCCGRSPSEREVIARVFHYHKTFRPTNVDYRCINVMIPSISKSGKRKIWCPRAFQRANKYLTNDIDVNSALTMYREGISFRFENQKPEWNEKAKSLVIKFQGNNRVLIPSTRNFLLCTSWDSTVKKKGFIDGISIDGEDEEEEDDDEDDDCDDDEDEKIAPMRSYDETIPDNSSIVSSSTHSSNTAGRSVLTPPKQSSGNSSPHQSVDFTQSAAYSPPNPHHLNPHTLRSKSIGNIKNPNSISSNTNSFAPASPHLLPYPHIARAHRTKSESSLDSESTFTTTASPTIGSKSNPMTSPKLRRKRSESRVLEDNDPSLQFGKATQTRYALDFKFPFSPIQAFGIALSSFAYEQAQLQKKSKSAEANAAKAAATLNATGGDRNRTHSFQQNQLPSAAASVSTSYTDAHPQPQSSSIPEIITSFDSPGKGHAPASSLSHSNYSPAPTAQSFNNNNSSCPPSPANPPTSTTKAPRLLALARTISGEGGFLAGLTSPMKSFRAVLPVTTDTDTPPTTPSSDNFQRKR